MMEDQDFLPSEGSEQSFKRKFVNSDTLPNDLEKSTAKKLQGAPKNSGTPIELRDKQIPKRNKARDPSGKLYRSGDGTLHNRQVQDIIEEFNMDHDSDSDQDLLNAEDFACLGQNKRAQDENSRSTFGLVDVPVPPVVNYFNDLPVEMMENIFSFLPMLDLASVCNRVCLKWMKIIENPEFCVWKKMYHRVKANVPGASTEVVKLMQEHGMEYPNQFLAGLITYMSKFKPIASRNMLSCLSKHGKYDWVVSLLRERMPGCMKDDEPNPWSAITALIILAESVKDITEILRHMLGQMSQCTSVQITECFYCVATFLFVFSKVKFNGPWQGMHYRLFYALYLYENTHTTTVDQMANAFAGESSQQSVMKSAVKNSVIRPTHEQDRIVKHNVNHGEIIKIIAFAGTGKTTTLLKYTQRRPNTRFLLAVFNKAIQVEADKVFPPNVACRTSHSLAYAIYGNRYRHKQDNYSLRAHRVIKQVRMRPGMNMYMRAKCIIDTVNNYIASADDNITFLHVPDTIKGQDGQPEVIYHEQKIEIVEDSDLIWRRMCDVRHSFGMSHDGYLKLYQLSKPILDEYDCILIDEAQDLTPCVQDILIRQPQAKILVGDPRQQIYAFRGAVDAMSQVRANKVFYLTQSFRFGPEIAFAASCCLQVLHNETRKTLVGCTQPGGITGESEGQIAIITRTNFELFRQAVLFVNDAENNGKTLAFIGGIKNFGFDTIEDIYYLLLPEEERGGRTAKTPFILRFQSLAELTAYAEHVDDIEIQGKIKIVNTYTAQTVPLMRKIESRSTPNQDLANFLLTTAHKAKGLEFPTVKLGEDFLNTVSQTDVNENLTDDAVKRLIKAEAKNDGKDD